MQLARAEARIRAAHDAVGPDVALHTGWAWTVTPGDAAAIAERLLPYDLFWIEEPFATDDPEELAALRRRIRPRLAGGEQLSTALPFRQLFEARALDVVMPDVKWIGGIAAFRELTALASAFDVEVSPHNMSGPVATAACVHVSTVLGNFLTLEYGYAGVPWRDELVAGSELVEDWHIPLPTAPGLGIEWDREAARRHAVHGWVAAAAAQPGERSTAMKWEYHVHVVDNDGDGFPRFSIDDLNALGGEGWELLHVNRLQGVTTGQPDGERLTRTKRVAIWFKRPRGD